MVTILCILLRYFQDTVSNSIKPCTLCGGEQSPNDHLSHPQSDNAAAVEWDGGDEYFSGGSHRHASLSPFETPTLDSSQNSARSQSANRDNMMDFNYHGEEDLWPAFQSVTSFQPSSPTSRASSLLRSSAYQGSPQAGRSETDGDENGIESDGNSVMSGDQEGDFIPAPSEGITRTFHPSINGYTFFLPFHLEQMLTCSCLVRKAL